MIVTPKLSHSRWLIGSVCRQFWHLTDLTWRRSGQSGASKTITPSSSIWRWQVTWRALIACRDSISHFLSASFPVDRRTCTSIKFQRVSGLFRAPVITWCLTRRQCMKKFSQCLPLKYWKILPINIKREKIIFAIFSVLNDDVFHIIRPIVCVRKHNQQRCLGIILLLIRHVLHALKTNIRRYFWCFVIIWITSLFIWVAQRGMASDLRWRGCGFDSRSIASALRNNLRQIVHTLAPLSSSSVILCR